MSVEEKVCYEGECLRQMSGRRILPEETPQSLVQPREALQHFLSVPQSVTKDLGWKKECLYNQSSTFLNQFDQCFHLKLKINTDIMEQHICG